MFKNIAIIRKFAPTQKLFAKVRKVVRILNSDYVVLLESIKGKTDCRKRSNLCSGGKNVAVGGTSSAKFLLRHALEIWRHISRCCRRRMWIRRDTERSLSYINHCAVFSSILIFISG